MIQMANENELSKTANMAYALFMYLYSYHRHACTYRPTHSFIKTNVLWFCKKYMHCASYNTQNSPWYWIPCWPKTTQVLIRRVLSDRIKWYLPHDFQL